MKLSDFLKLSSDETVIEQAILAHSEKAGEELEDKLRDLILGTDLASLIKLSIKHPKINELCESKAFARHWQNLWKKSGVYSKEKATESEAKIEYQPIATVSCFNLLKGIYIYEGYRIQIKNNTINAEIIREAQEYLELAAKYGCFFALNALCREGLAFLKGRTHSTVERVKIAQDVLSYAESTARLYWTPGYFLLANVYQELLSYATELLPDKGALSKKYIRMQAITALHVAQKMEEFSIAMLRNAYQGKTLQEASQGKFISWFNAKLKIKERGKLSMLEYNEAIRSADNIVEEIQNQYSLNDEQKDKKLSLAKAPPVA